MSNVQHYVGFVLAEREQNLRDDSYFHLTVWNPDECAVETFEYASTAYGSTPLQPEGVRKLLDATLPSVRGAAKAWHDRNDRVAAARMILWRMDTHGYHVFEGDTVRVARGRKVPKGTTGTVLRVDERVTHTSRYGTWQTKKRFALIDGPSGAWSVDVEHLEIVERGPVMQELFDVSH